MIHLQFIIAFFARSRCCTVPFISKLMEYHTCIFTTKQKTNKKEENIIKHNKIKVTKFK